VIQPFDTAEDAAHAEANILAALAPALNRQRPSTSLVAVAGVRLRRDSDEPDRATQ
jgi:hypothetical protein